VVITSPIVQQPPIEDTFLYELHELISKILDRPIALIIFTSIAILGYFAFKE